MHQVAGPAWKTTMELDHAVARRRLDGCAPTDVTSSLERS